MNKKFLIIAVVMVLLLGALALVACVGNTSYEEIIQVGLTNDFIVAKSKDAFNVFDKKGKKLFKNDYDSISILSNDIIKAKNNDSVHFDYFNLKGEKLPFAVEGLYITEVMVNCDRLITRNSIGDIVNIADGNVSGYQVMYKDNLLNTFVRLYNSDLTIKFDNTALSKNVSPTYLVETELITLRKEDPVDNDKTSNQTKKNMVNCYYLTQTINFYIEQPTGQKAPKVVNKSITIFDNNVNALYNKSYSESDVDVKVLKEKDCYLIKSTSKINLDYSVDVVNLKNKLTKYFKNVQNDSIEILKNLVFQYDSTRNTTYIYNIDANKEKTFNGVAKDVFNNYIVIQNNNSNKFSLVDADTFNVVMTNIADYGISNEIINIDGKYYDSSLNVISAYNKPIISRSLLFVNNNVNMPINFYAVYYEDGTGAILKNNQTILTLKENDLVQALDNYLVDVKNYVQNTINTYLLLDTTLDMSGIETISKKEDFIAFTKYGSNDKITKVYIIYKATLFVYDMPDNVDGVNVYTELKDDLYIINIVYTYVNDINKYSLNYIYYYGNQEYNINNSLETGAPLKLLHNVKATNCNITARKIDTILEIEEYTPSDLKTGTPSKYVTTYYQIQFNYADKSYSYNKLSQLQSVRSLTVKGDYVLERYDNSKFHNVYNIKTGVKLVNREFEIISVIGNLAVFANNDITKGVLQFTDKGYKILDKAKYLQAQLITAEVYIIALLDKDGLPKVSLKNNKGKTLIKNASDIKFFNDQKVDNLKVEKGKFDMKIVYQPKPGGAFKVKYLSDLTYKNYQLV